MPSRAGPQSRSGPRTQTFRERFYTRVCNEQWNDWRWQVRNRIKNLQQLSRIMELSQSEVTALERHGGSLPMGITPYYASLLDPHNPDQPLRRTVVITSDEFRRNASEASDPLEEESDSPVPGLIHRYPDRVAFLVTTFCPVYCRYCTRSRIARHRTGQYRFGVEQWTRAINYIAATPSIRDVLISGGDPLILSDNRLEWLLSRLRRIPHVEFLRIGSKVPAVLPQRITPNLLKTLKRYHPLWMSIHFIHPEEFTPEVDQACARLADAGIPLGSHTVLLAGVNDDLGTMRKLFHGLLKMRVRPYYLFQCDLVLGTSHFRTPVEKGMEIIRGLRGHTTGYAVPTYSIDVPGGGGKIALHPDYYLGREGDDIILQNYQGKIYHYPDLSMPHGNHHSLCDGAIACGATEGDSARGDK